MLTRFVEICAVCGRTTECQHHLIFGTGMRKLADEDGLTMPMCNRCHNMGRQAESIHGNPIAEDLSKMLGQLLWEKEHILKGVASSLGEDTAKQMDRDSRANFMTRYGRSYL